MPKRSSNRPPRALNQLAVGIVDAATGEAATAEPQAAQDDPPAKNPHAAALGKLGGLKGGPARAAKLSPEQRWEIAKKAARARWDAD
jgi:hypothetical protein